MTHFKPLPLCSLDAILPMTGVAALIDGEQIAVFRLADDRVFALANFDPFSQANVISRGIVGDLQGQWVVASPMYKQHFNLETGQCLEDDSVQLTTYPVAVEDGKVNLLKPSLDSVA